jgi:hypothetical protein
LVSATATVVELLDEEDERQLQSQNHALQKRSVVELLNDDQPSQDTATATATTIAPMTRVRTLSDPSAMLQFTLKSFLTRLAELRLELQALAHAVVQSPGATSNLQTAERLDSVQQTLSSLQQSALACDPGSTLQSGRVEGVQWQEQVLAECDELVRQASELRAVLSGSGGALLSPTVTTSAKPMPPPPLLPESSSPSHIDPIISTLVARALTGRFAAVATSAIANSVGQDAQLLYKKLEDCNLMMLASVLSANGYKTLRDVAEISSSEALRLLGLVVEQMEMKAAQTGNVSSRPLALNSSAAVELTAPLVSEIDRGLVVVDYAAVLG